jgi:hypothetical protein
VKPMEKEKKTQKDGTTVIECMAEGIPKPKLTWYKNGKPLETNQQRYFFTAENQLLIIVQTQASDAGIYMCEKNIQKPVKHVSAFIFIFCPEIQLSVKTCANL